MKESFASEHSGELFGHTLEQLLDGGTVSNEGGGHLETAWWDVAHSGLHVVGDPFHEVAAVLVLHIQHLLVHLLHGHATTEHGCDCEVTAMTRIASGHHVLGIKHLLGQLGHRQCAVLLGSAAGEWSEAGHEEVQTERDAHTK